MNHGKDELVGSGGIALKLLILFFIFIGFSVICEKYLIRVIQQIQIKFGISDRLAGSTIIAFSGCISEIASNMRIVLSKTSDRESSSMGITGIIGASICEITVGLGIGCLMIRKNYSISYYFFVRDTIIYLAILVYLRIITIDREIDLAKSVSLVGLWIVYLIYLWITSQTTDPEKTEIILKAKEEMQDSISFQSVMTFEFHIEDQLTETEDSTSGIAIKEEGNEFLSEGEKYQVILSKKINYVHQQGSDVYLMMSGFIYAFSYPWKIVLSHIIPINESIFGIIIRLVIPLAIIWYTTEIVIEILNDLIFEFKLPSSFVGVTLLSWGSIAPDLFNIGFAMKKGMIELALNATFASEIHVLLFGLGMPWLIYNIKYESTVFLDKDPLTKFSLFYFTLILVFLILALKLNRKRLNLRFSIFLFSTYFIFLAMVCLITIVVE